MMISKVTKNQGFTLFFEETFFEKPRGGHRKPQNSPLPSNTHSPSRLRVIPVKTFPTIRNGVIVKDIQKTHVDKHNLDIYYNPNNCGSTGIYTKVFWALH